MKRSSDDPPFSLRFIGTCADVGNGRNGRPSCNSRFTILYSYAGDNGDPLLQALREADDKISSPYQGISDGRAGEEKAQSPCNR